MKELLRIIWVMFIQCIACWFAGWDISATLFVLVATILWQGVFVGINYRIRLHHKNESKDITVLTYLLLSFPALFSPFISTLICNGWMVFRTLKISGVTILDTPLGKALILNNKHSHDCNSDSVEFERTNPATGLVMHGGTDIAGNPYGLSNYP